MTPDSNAPTPRLLSSRERSVLELIARGTIDKTIGERLGIALGTVRVYRKRVEKKLGVRGAMSSALVAWQLGELDLETIAREMTAVRDVAPEPSSG